MVPEGTADLAAALHQEQPAGPAAASNYSSLKADIAFYNPSFY